MHNTLLYSTLLHLARNIFFYKNIKLKDTFETRLYLMLFHFSLILIIFKYKKQKFNQNFYDSLFNHIENDLRESGLGDVTVNKKMKDINKILYDILLKINISKTKNSLILNDHLIKSYFKELNNEKSHNYKEFCRYFLLFFNFCFELPKDIMLRELKNFKF